MKRYEEARNFMDAGLTTYEQVLAEIKTIEGIENPEEYAEEIMDAIEHYED